MVSKDSLANQRPFYFSHVRVSPTDPGTVYGVSILLATSYNGGEKFNLSAFSVHPDLHDMWISSDGNRMALAGDGGIAISTNGGATWANSRNIAIGQVYRVGLSNTIPYLVCGGLQDNNAYCGPAFNGNSDGITNRDWFKIVEGDGEWAVPDPTNPRLDLGGFAERRTGRLRPRLARIHQRAPVSRNSAGRFRPCHIALSLQLAIAGCICRLRSARRLHRRQRALPDERRRQTLEGDQPRPYAQR